MGLRELDLTTKLNEQQSQEIKKKQQQLLDKSGKIFFSIKLDERLNTNVSTSIKKFHNV